MEKDLVAEQIVNAILSNLLDRRGIRQAFEDIDDDIMDELRADLKQEVITVLSSHLHLEETI